MGRLIKENEMRYYGVKIKRDKQILGNKLMYSSKKQAKFLKNSLWLESYNKNK